MKTKAELKEMAKELEKVYDVHIIGLVVTGSRMTGTNNSGSDADYKAIFIPTIKSMYLGNDKRVIIHNQSKEKNNCNDTDIELINIKSLINKLVVNSMQEVIFVQSLLSSRAYLNTTLDFSALEYGSGLYDNLWKSWFGFGDRVFRANQKNPDQPDWKLIADSLRTFTMMMEIITTGKIIYPLYNAQLIKDIRAEKYSFVAAMEMVEKARKEAQQSEQKIIPVLDNQSRLNLANQLKLDLICTYHKVQI